MEVIVSDSTTLVVLETLQSLNLLCAVFTTVIIPSAVLSELEVGSPKIKEKVVNTGCFEFVELKKSEQLSSLKIMLDPGEAEAITLALEHKLMILIDERKGRAVAKQLNLKVTGFIGLLILGVSRKTLSPEKAQEMLDQAIANGFRLSTALYKKASAAFIASNSQLGKSNNINTLEYFIIHEKVITLL